MTLELKGRSAIITGGTQGLGLQIARHYLLSGANVLICARTGQDLERACVELDPLRNPGQIVEAAQGDVTIPHDVERVIDTALTRFPSLEILVNNAGVYGPKGSLDETDWDDWKRAIEINLYGPVLFCRGLLPHFKKQRYGKIVQLSGGGATNPLPRISAYAASKAALVRLTETIAEEVREYRIDVNAIAPGALNTRLLDEVLESGPAKVGEKFFQKALKQKREGGTPMSRGADLAVFLASGASDGITGRLISAVWDPWQTLSHRIEELKNSDIYTLRRIVPEDRGAGWQS